MTAALAALREPTFVLGSVVLLGLLALAVIGPWIAPYDPVQTVASLGLSGPSPGHWMGTDQLGRDILSRVIFGARISMVVAVSAVGVSSAIGTVLGLVTGYLRGWTDSVLMRLMDILLAFPGLILALVAVAVLGPGVVSVIIAVGVAGAPTFARITRGSVLSVAQEDYVLAASAVGAHASRVMFRHILPNVVGPIAVLATLNLAGAVLATASLSFLGVGVQPPTAEWGEMVNEGRNVLVRGWWVSGFPSLMILLFVLAVNLAGEVLREQLDATLRMRTSRT